MLDTRVRFYARTPTALFQKMTPPTAQRPPSTLSVNTYARRCVRGRACAQASCARDAHRVHRFDPFSSSIVQFVLPFQRLLFSLFSFQIRSFFTTISSLVPQEQDFSIYHSSVIPFEQRTLGFLFLRRNDDTDREIRER